MFVKDNLYNRIFRRTRLEEQRTKYQNVCKDVEKADELLRAVSRSNSLMQLLTLHNLTMKPEEVFLGNIYGLWTFPIPDWENNRNALYGANDLGINPGTRAYDLILCQYRNLLQSNLTAIIQPEKDWMEEYKKYV